LGGDARVRVKKWVQWKRPNFPEKVVEKMEIFSKFQISGQCRVSKIDRASEGGRVGSGGSKGADHTWLGDIGSILSTDFALVFHNFL
jgi:hypothetical protein